MDDYLDMYGEQTKDIPPKPESIIYLDCDKGFTLMQVIKKVRKMISNVSDDTIITIYFVKGTNELFEFKWKFLCDYLYETNRSYQIVFRGYFELDAALAYSYENLDVYLVKGSLHRNVNLNEHFNRYNIKVQYI